MKIVVLVSGGIDSTVLAFALASKPKIEEIQPVYVSFRGSGGKEAIEISVARELLIHPKIKPLHILKGKQFHIDKESYDTRNVQLLKFGEWCAESLSYDSVALGTSGGYNFFDRGNMPDEENIYEYLQQQVKIKLFTLDSFDCKNKVDVINLGKPFFGDNIFKTYSCQLWHKVPCGHCYSDVERHLSLLFAYGYDNTVYRLTPETSKQNYNYFKEKFEQLGYKVGN